VRVRPDDRDVEATGGAGDEAAVAPVTRRAVPPRRRSSLVRTNKGDTVTGPWSRPTARHHEWFSAQADSATWPLTTCTRAAAPPNSSNERRQSGPHSDQTKSHSGGRDISAHRLSPFARRMAIARALRCDLGDNFR
jgi:hypothetical protein